MPIWAAARRAASSGDTAVAATGRVRTGGDRLRVLAAQLWSHRVQNGPADLEACIRAARDGDEAARDRLISDNLPWIRAVLRLEADSVVRQKESSSDLAQSICVEILQHLDTFEFRGEASFRSWLHTWICNKLKARRRYYLAQKRDARREVGHPNHGTSLDERLLNCYATFCTPSRVAEHREAIERVEEALDRLPDDYRAVIVQAQLLRLPHAEIAGRMGRSEGATRVLLHRAVVRLAALLDVAGDDERT